MGKIAFVFAGQGAQYVGMGKDIYENFESAREIYNAFGEEVTDISFNGPKESLDITVNTQPCVFAADLACAAALKESGVHPAALAGFSLGEIPALTYGGILSLAQAADFVRFRAEVMHECALNNEGEMFAVLRLSDRAVEDICLKIGEAYPVNYNCDGQVTVACAGAVSGELKAEVAAQKGKLMKLPVSGAFHSPFMDSASEQISVYLRDIDLGAMEIPVYSNVTALVYGDRDLIARQVNSPVLWKKTVTNMINDGIDTFIEVGPGNILTGLIKKINKDVRVFNVGDTDSLNKTLEVLNGS